MLEKPIHRLAEARRVAMLETPEISRPQGALKVVLDTDTYNEIDDQFALIYAIKAAERISLEAVYAAPFANRRSTGPADGMEKSFAEITRILSLLERSDIPAYRGSTAFMGPEPVVVESDAARDLVERARKVDVAADGPLYVLAIGAPTNVSSALLMAPDIVEKIVVVWLGGNTDYWPDTREFNLQQDFAASSILFDSGVPLVRVPCMGVTSHLLTTIGDLEASIGGRGAIADYLIEIFREHEQDHLEIAKVIWDISTVAYLINPTWVPSRLETSPVLNSNMTFSRDPRRHLVRTAYYVDRGRIFKDMYSRFV